MILLKFRQFNNHAVKNYEVPETTTYPTQ